MSKQKTRIVRGKYLIKNDGSDPSGGVVEEGALFIRGEKIIDVGNYREISKKYSADELIGNNNQVILPGLVNAHYHGRGLTSFELGTVDDPLETWIMYVRAGGKADPYWDTLYATTKLIEAGVTTTVHSNSTADPREFEEQALKRLRAYEESGMRVAFALDVRNQNSFVYDDDKKFLAGLPPDLCSKLEALLSKSSIGAKRQLHDRYFLIFDKISKQYHGKNGKINIFFGPVSPVWVSDDLMVKIKNRAKDYSTGIHMHCLETLYQKHYSFRKYGKSIIEHLEKMKILGPEVSCAHCVWVTGNDISILADAGSSVAHNPSANLRLKSGVAPLLRLLEKGVNTGLGLDGMTLNDTDDILEEMRLCSKLHWVPGVNESSLSTIDVLKMATTSGAKIAQFENIGILQKGFKADIILLDFKDLTVPYLEMTKNILDVIITKGSAAFVNTVLIGGEVVMRNRKLLRVNKGEIIKELKNSLKGLKAGELVEFETVMKRVKPYIKSFYREWNNLPSEPYYVWNSRL